MPIVSTAAIVLHVFDYMETSRILRLATRELGVQSVLARGARRSSGRFGSALDLFAEGVAQIDVRPGRDLQTLTGFDVTLSRPALALEMPRLVAAAALSECVQRLVTEDHAQTAYDITRNALDALASVPTDAVTPSALAALWHLVAELGFAPSLESCASCHRPIGDQAAFPFSHAAGGVLCATCASRAPGARRLPRDAVDALMRWTVGEVEPEALSDGASRAHQRLLREFLGQHLTDTRSMKAWSAWERGGWE